MVVHSSQLAESQFYSRCMECQRGLATRKVSVRLSVKRVHRDKTEERYVQIFIPCERSLSLVFRKKNGWWGRRLLPEILGQPAPVKAKSPIFSRYSLVAPQR